MPYTHEPGCGHEPVAKGFDEDAAGEYLEYLGSYDADEANAAIKRQMVADGLIADDTPNPTEPPLSDSELVAVRRLLRERYEDPEARERALYEELFLPDRASRDIPPSPARSQWSDLADRMVNHLPSAAGEFDIVTRSSRDADLARLAATKTAHDVGASRRIRVDINLDPPDKIAEMELQIAVSKFLGREYGFDKVLLLTSERVADEEWRQ